MQVREYGMSVLSSSYRQLPQADAQHMLGIAGPQFAQQLVALLETLSSRSAAWGFV